MRTTRLRGLLAAWAAFLVGDYAHYVLAVMWAFSAGGAATVGAATVLNVLPGALLGPLATTLATSVRPHVHLAVGIGARSALTFATMAAVLAGAPIGLVLTLIAVDSVVSVAVRPLHFALVVRLADTTAEAAAANAATSSLVSGSALVGPVLAGAAVAFFGVGWAFGLPAVAFALGVLAASLLRVPAGGLSPAGGGLRSQLGAVRVGFAVILHSPPATAATILFVADGVLLGAWFVASAPVAADHLALGEGGVATIITVYGVGGVIGALATLSVVGRRGLSRVLMGAMLALTLALGSIGAVFVPLPGLLLAAALGAAAGVLYAIAPTLVQRGVAERSDRGDVSATRAMVSASASLQSLYLVGMAVGAMVSPLLFDVLGVTSALVVLAGAAAAVTLAAWPSVRRADVLSDDDAAKLAVLMATPLLAPLPGLALERLALTAARLTTAAGSDVVVQGDRGDRFYMIVTGLADVAVDERRVATLGPGGSFGEIALLADVPRSATVTARRDLELLVVDRAEFVGALSGTVGAIGRGIAGDRLATPPVDERLAEVDRAVALGGRCVVKLLARQAPLAGAAVRELADAARVVAAPDGALITREGDYGDTYYVILDGAAQVFEGQTPVARLGPGDGFGERAILRDVPRTASVRAVGDTTLVAVDRESFQRARRPG